MSSLTVFFLNDSYKVQLPERGNIECTCLKVEILTIKLFLFEIVSFLAIFKREA